MTAAMKKWECCDGVAFLRTIGLKSGDKVVDFGCRIGHYSIPAAFSVGHSGTVYALDKDQKPLDQLIEKAREYGLENIKAIRTSGQLDADIESRMIDVVLLYDVLHYLTQNQRRTLFREAFRVLKPTGMLSVYPKHTLEDWPLRELKNLRISDVEREICGCRFRSDGLYEAVISHDDALEPGRVMNFRKR
jgi:ubiquinone/menaquinone biosynthesis C-methylase UbiE